MSRSISPTTSLPWKLSAKIWFATFAAVRRVGPRSRWRRIAPTIETTNTTESPSDAAIAPSTRRNRPGGASGAGRNAGRRLGHGERVENCLTAAQVEGARKVYTPARNARTGKDLFGPLAPGSELGWASMAAGPEPYAPAVDQLKFVVFKDANWDWRTFDFKQDVARFELPQNLIMNATDPNVRKFFAHNGKLLVYQGWNDQNVSPYNTVNYFKSVQEAIGGASKTGNNIRLFMLPGMAHCSGGEGPNTFDKIGTLDRWVEQDKAPDTIIASHSTNGKIDRTRPLCPYPQVAKYKGSGSIDDAANFECR